MNRIVVLVGWLMVVCGLRGNAQEIVNLTGSSGQFGITQTAYVHNLNKQFHINVGSATLITLNLTVGTEENWDLVKVYECNDTFSDLREVMNLSGSGSHSYTSANINGKLVVQFTSDGNTSGDKGYTGFMANYEAVPRQSVPIDNSLSSSGSVELGKAINVPNLQILDHYEKSMGDVSSVESDYSQAYLLLQSDMGKKLGLGYDKVSSNGKLGITADGPISFSSSGHFYFNTPNDLKSVDLHKGNINISCSDPSVSNEWLRYSIDDYKYVAFSSGKLSTGYCNFMSARNNDVGPILYYSLKSSNIGNDFNGQAGLVFDVKYTNNETGVGDNDAFLFKSGWSNRLMSITGKGDVFIKSQLGIGKVATCALDVVGTIKAKEIKVTAQTADFVFEEDYQLRSLEEVNSFITTNKHLPEIPSATQMEVDGVNLAEMNKLLLQKIEELTLYMIDQEQRIKELEQKVEGK